MRAEGLAVTRLALRQTRRSALLWGAIVCLLFATSAEGYQNLYTDDASRRRFAASIGGNNGFSAILGVPRRIETTGGFLAWRIGVIVAVVLAFWAMLLATRLLRGEEDAGRVETLAAGPLTLSALTGATLAAIVIAALVPFAGGVLAALLVAAGTDLGVVGAVWLSLGWILCALAFAAVGAFAAQCVAPRSRATLVASVALGITYLARLIADAEPRFRWLRWASPFGWLEEAHVYSGTRWAVFGLHLAWILAFGGAAIVFAARRDIGASLISVDSAAPGRARFPGNPVADALRFVRATVIGWAVAGVSVAFVLGLLAPSVARAVVDAGLETKFGGVLGRGLGTPSGYLGATFVIVIAALVALSPSGHVTSARDEEASGRLDTYLAGAVSRRQWLWARVAVAVGGACLVAFAAAVAGWTGQRITGGDVPFAKLAVATACYVPLAMVFGAIGLAMLGAAPRATHGLVATLVGLAFLVEVVGAVLRAPQWFLDLSPFTHLGVAPAQPAHAFPALLMLAISAVLGVFGVEVFARRDLTGE